MRKDFLLISRKNNRLRITSYGIENIQYSPCIIIVHGFKGFKDWGFIPYSANYFAEKGFFVLTFNFSHNGVGESLTEFVEMDKFSENTPTLEISELSEMTDAYLNGFFGKSEIKKLGFLGHSRGGAISMLTAVLKPEVTSVAVWASIAAMERYTERQKEEWKRTGFVEVLNTRTNQLMRLNVSLLEDIEQNKDDLLNIENAVKNLNRPLFIAHGDQDLSVPIKEGEQLYEWADKSTAEFYKLFNTGHTFDVKHPFEGTNDKFEKLLEKTTDFFRNNLH